MNWIIGFLCFLAASVLSAFCLAFPFGGLNKVIAWLSLFFGFLVAFFAFTNCKNTPSPLKKSDFSFWTLFTIIVYLIFSLRSFLWLIFRKGDTLQILSPHNMGDLSLHITYIKYLANGVSFWPDNPILTGAKLMYPIGPDLFNSLLLLAGVDLIQGLVWVGLLCSIAASFTLLLWGKTFTLAGYLFNGGLAGFLFYKQHELVNYQWDLAWKSIPLTLFVTQRGYLFALPAGLLLLYSWQERFFVKASNKKPTMPFWIEVLLYSSMPIFHMHTFVFLSMLLGIWLLIGSSELRVKIFNLIKFSVLPVVFIVITISNSFGSFSIVHFKPGWMQGDQNFFYFWLWNFGLFIPLVCILLFKLLLDKENRQLFKLNSTTAFVYPTVILFLFYCFVMFHPWDWDNIKLFMWCYLILLPFIWDILMSKQDKFVQCVVCFSLFFSGFLYIVEGIGTKYTGFENWKVSELREVEHSVRNLPVKFRFASYPTYNHPLLFCGRKVVLGYPGHIWALGFNYADIEQKLKIFMLGDLNWKNLAKELGIKYVFWGPREEKEYATSTKPWEQFATEIASGDWGKIYDLGEL